MNQIINSQRPTLDKIGLGYNRKDAKLGSSSKIGKDDKRSYVDIVRESCKRENCESLKENIQKVEMKKQEEDKRAWREFVATHDNDLRRHAPLRRPPMPRYQGFFSGLCYASNNYGHKAIDCRTYT